MRPALGLASATLCVLAIQAPAQEMLGGFVDMRLTVGTLATGDYENALSGIGTVEDSWDWSVRMKAEWVGSLGLRSYGGWIWMIGGSYNYYDDDLEFPGGKIDTHLQGFTIRGGIGYAIPFGESFQLEILPFLGLGRAYLDTNGLFPGGEENHEAADVQVEYGFDVNGVFTFGNGFQLGLNAGLVHYHTDIIHDVAQQTGSALRNWNYESNMIDVLGGFDVTVGVFIGVRL